MPVVNRFISLSTEGALFSKSLEEKKMLIVNPTTVIICNYLLLLNSNNQPINLPLNNIYYSMATVKIYAFL